MLTLEKLTAAAKDLPAEFSLDQLVNKLTFLEQHQDEPVATQVELARYTSPEAREQYARFPAPSTLASLCGIAAGLPPEQIQMSAKEWEAARIREKYGV